MTETNNEFKIYDELPTGVLIYRVKESLELIYVNKKLVSMFECENEEQLIEFVGNDLSRMIHKDDLEEVYRLTNTALENQIEMNHHLQYRINTIKGNYRTIDDTGKVIYSNTYGDIVLNCITEINDDILANHETMDKLTKLFRKNQFYDFAKEIIVNQEEFEVGKYNFLFFNIRNFKNYNLQAGMDCGDKVLVNLAEIIKKYSDTNIISRFNGDHFVMFSKAIDIYDIARNIITEFNLKYSDYAIKLKAGIFPVNFREIEVSSACDLAKSACDSIRNSAIDIRVYDEMLHKKINQGSYIVNSLDDAIRKNYIKVYYQPIMRTLTGALCGLEALARWEDPNNGLYMPGDFIDVLEDNRLITKLDLHILELICKDIREYEYKGYHTVPVSINLSRLDFLECNIFEEVDKIVLENHVARDMIRIEVTESMIMDDPDIYKRVIRKFRTAGYEVWMDDFGSGYSSLNVLREFEFDEIKLDMEFMHTFDEKTRCMLKSIVTMAKGMGIKTLSEGVETQEQFEFLKEIGCGKAQGYLFNKPDPIAKIVDKYFKLGQPVEKRVMHSYYDKVDSIDFLTDNSMAIMEYTGKNFQFLFVNDAYKKVWESMGSSNMDFIYENLNAKTSMQAKAFRKMHELLKVGEEHEIRYTVQGKYLRIRAKKICQYENQSINQIELTNLTYQEGNNKQEQIDSIYKMIYSMYDSVAVIKMEDYKFISIHGTVQSLLKLNNRDEMQFFDENTMADIVIHPQDREEYLQFAEMNDILERISKTSKGYVSGVYRTRNLNGSYEWKIHSMMYDTFYNMLIYTTKYIPITRERIIRGVIPEYESENPAGVNKIIWKRMMESKNINIFWKDTERRFLGANKRFLETYGLKDVLQILGKTDEDMRWHPDNGPFRDDEINVIEKGSCISNRLGKCVIKGKVHSILVSKEPIYHNGEIIGLLGSFIDIEDIIDQFGIISYEDNRDTMTNLLSLQGFINILSDYMENNELMQEKFASITITFEEYQRAIKTYGDKAAREIIYGIGEVLKEQCESHLIPARIYGGNFAILTKYQEKDEVERVADYIRVHSKDVHHLSGYKVTLNPTVKTYYSEDVKDAKEMVAIASGGASVDIDFGRRKKLEEQLRDYNVRFETLVNTIPGGIALMEVVDNKFKIVYQSEGVAKITARKTSEFEATMTQENKYGVVEEDVSILKNASEQAINNKQDIDITYRVYHKDGHIIWLHMFGKFIGEQNGHPLLMAVYQDVSEKYREQNIAKRIINNIPGAIAVFELKGKSLKRVFISEQADKFIGGGLLENEEFENFDLYVYPDDMEHLKIAASPENLISRGINTEFRTIGKNGEIYWVHFTANPILQADGSYIFYGVYTDITELKRKEGR